MERSNVPAVILSCKSLAAAYHSSINFSKAIHVAQIQVLYLFNRPFAQKLSCYLGSATVWARFAMGPGPICLNQMELRVHLYEVYLEVRGLHPTGSWKWRVSDDEVLGKQIIRVYLCELFPFMIVLNF